MNYLVEFKDGVCVVVESHSELGAINEAVTEHLQYETTDVVHVEEI